MLIPKNVKSITPESSPIFITKVPAGQPYVHPADGNLYKVGEKVTLGDTNRYDYYARYLGYGLFEETIAETCKIEYK